MAVLEETAAKLTPLEWQALRAAAKGADGSRADLSLGKGQGVDLLLRIKGTVDVGEDGETSRAARPSAIDVLAWVLAQPIGESNDQMLQRMRLDAEQHGGKLPEVEEGYVAAATMAILAVSPSVKIPRKGSIRGTLRVGVVNSAQLSQEVSGAVEQCTRMIALGE